MRTVVKIQVKFEIRDLWVGVYWDTDRQMHPDDWSETADRTCIYICIVPCFPILIEIYR